ncbi:MAG TPA: hypothetical protein VGI20_10980 [Rhizomicrobium sp.]|jgi:hypothetical protein
MDGSGSNETIRFNGGAGYYGQLANGYGGFDWSLVDYLNATYWQNVQTEWCDTGYQNVIHGPSDGYIYKTGLIQSSNLSETFNLRSMIAASAWESNQAFLFNSYVYKHHAFVLKASDYVDFTQTAQTVDFSTVGIKASDFRNVAAVTITQEKGIGGSTCSYGTPTYGVTLALDNLKVHWNGPIPDAHGTTRTLQTPHGVLPRHTVAHVTAQNPMVVHHADGGAHSHTAPGHEASGFHSMIASLDAALGHESGSLTSQFVLPHVEHFGT